MSQCQDIVTRYLVNAPFWFRLDDFKLCTDYLAC